MLCWPSQEKLSKWLARIHSALETNTLCGGEASKLSGQLQWCSQKVFRRAGRAMVRPIIEYGLFVQIPGYYRSLARYSARQVRARSSAVNDRLRTALKWWQQTLQLNLRYNISQAERFVPYCILVPGSCGNGGSSGCHQSISSRMQGHRHREWPPQSAPVRSAGVNPFAILPQLLHKISQKWMDPYSI